jgi:MerR family transcriptional regulator, copper efflux regulator
VYIGQIAALCGVTAKAIRHYESLGLIPTPRRQGRYRVYDSSYVMLIATIRRSQAAGFTLAEMHDIARAKATSDRFPVESAQRLLVQKLASLQERRRALDRIEQALRQLGEELKASHGDIGIHDLSP